MADVDNQHDSSFPVKRKSDLCCQNQDNAAASKAQKLNPSSDSESKDGGIDGSGVQNLNSSAEEKIGAESSISPEKVACSGSGKDENNGVARSDEEEECGNGEEDEGEEEDEDDSIEAEIDTKGKGISREDKGKGKLIEEDDSDEDDDSDDDDDDDEDDESGLSDDPLAEVDLDNILPSRTRRRSNQPPGVHISNRTSDYNDEDDDDSSDDSDA